MISDIIIRFKVPSHVKEIINVTTYLFNQQIFWSNQIFHLFSRTKSLLMTPWIRLSFQIYVITLNSEKFARSIFVDTSNFLLSIQIWMNLVREITKIDPNSWQFFYIYSHRNLFFYDFLCVLCTHDIIACLSKKIILKPE